MVVKRIAWGWAWAAMALAAGVPASAQSARDACADAARALVRQQPSWDDYKSKGSDVLRWRAADGSRGFCRVDGRGRVYAVEVEEWGGGEIDIGGGGGITTEEGRDRRGSDYTNFGVRSLGECQDGCRNDARCRAYTYSERDRRCWLKSSAPASQYSPGMVTGVKNGSGGSGQGGYGGLTTERGINRGGSDYRSFAASGLGDCQDACRRESRCQAYTYNVPSRTCYLKDRVPSGRNDPDTVAGYKDR